MTKGKLGLHVYVGTLLVLSKPSERDNDHGTIRVEDNEARIDASVGRMKL